MGRKYAVIRTGAASVGRSSAERFVNGPSSRSRSVRLEPDRIGERTQLIQLGQDNVADRVQS